MNRPPAPRGVVLRDAGVAARAELTAIPLVRDLAGAIDDLLDASAARHGIGRGDRRALELIALCPGISASELAFRRRVTTGCVTGILDRLSDAGLAERRENPGDRRVVRICLTRDGCEVHRETWEPLGRRLEQRMAGFTSAEVAIVLAVLSAVTEVIRQAGGRSRG